MSIDAQFLSMMPTVVTVYPNSGLDAYGKISHGATGVAVRCRVQDKDTRYATERNRDEFNNGTIIFYGCPDITISSKIVLPDGTSPIILSVDNHNDESGLHHTTVTFGK
ncbi:hypothetical protein UFOVP1296_30 [uncultured Caudovirales phage]|uniref:Uncharacterized protein n=1 Tax=uncultured Caudovirales phage TaxID=2100421 RepID=A0A6J5RNE6_9CAUD|nr:hypothetical protein UFOVP471_64 [uncultured Caudovirales phage]CAB4169424.1 hypothetical protein UFOVP890_30 [uncultured Caudovirales phage]CAB4195706.1 hypothetical protein UFOVP1296_30 [uncultured Caudovirales phage]